MIFLIKEWKLFLDYALTLFRTNETRFIHFVAIFFFYRFFHSSFAYHIKRLAENSRWSWLIKNGDRDYRKSRVVVVILMYCIQCSKKRMVGSIISPITQIKSTNKCYNFSSIISGVSIHNHSFLMMCIYCSRAEIVELCKNIFRDSM